MRSIGDKFELTKKAKANTLIFSRIHTMQIVRESNVLCLYVSKSDEPDTKVLLQEFLTKRDKTVVLPKIVEGSLLLYKVSTMQDLKNGKYNILEPKASCSQTEAKNVDLFIIPGLAFGLDGSRLGRGKGYYDRLLQRASATTIALAYDFQVLPTIPHDANDRKVDIIVTPTKTYDLRHTSISSYKQRKLPVKEIVV